MKVFFVVPAYNEADNIPDLLADLVPRARALDARVIVVDDGSRDGTAEEVARSRAGYPITIVRHVHNMGLGRSMDTGLRVALGEASENDAIVTLEADNTSDLDILPQMLSGIEGGNDIVVSSVYAPGGRLVGVGRLRLLLSRALSELFRLVGQVREVHTLSSVFRVYRAGPVRRAVQTYGYLLIREPGYAASLEILLKLRGAGATVTEVATVNDWTKRHGTSKMQIRPALLAYFRLTAAHLAGVIQPPPGSPMAEDEDGLMGATIEELEQGSAPDEVIEGGTR